MNKHKNDIDHIFAGIVMGMVGALFIIIGIIWPTTEKVVEFREVALREQELVCKLSAEILGNSPQPEVEIHTICKITAYCPCEICCGKTDGITYSGTIATAGRTCAADPNVFPIGTVVEVDGLGQFTVEDIGGAVKGLHIDVFYNTHDEAWEQGVLYREVKIIDNQEDKSK